MGTQHLNSVDRGGEERVEAVARIGELIRAQDNRCTEAPIFAVQARRRIWGAEEGDGFAWMDDEGEEVGGFKAARLERNYQVNGDTPKGYARIGYLDIWEFVTACFTEEGCKALIRANGHNLKEPRIYAYGSWRNAEWQTIRDHLAAASRTPLESDR